MPIEIRHPGQEKLFRGDNNPSTTKQWSNQLYVKYELALLLEAIGLLNLLIYSYDVLQDEGIISSKLVSQNKVLLLPIVNSAGVNMDPFTTYFLPFPSCNSSITSFFLK